MMVLSVLPAMAAQNGSITNIYPPDKKGQSHGVGFIDNGDGKKYVFKIQDDNNDSELSVGDHVTFDITHGRHVTNVHVIPETCPGSPDETPPCPDT